MRMRRHYPRENPITPMTFGLLAAGGVVLAGVAYLAYKGSASSSSVSSTFTAGSYALPWDAIPFKATDFSLPSVPDSIQTGTEAINGFNATLVRSTGTSLNGMWIYDPASMATGVVAFVVETDDGTGLYGAGSTISGVPVAYVGAQGSKAA